MHKKAKVYEDAAIEFREKGKTHEMHCAMDNGRCLRVAANILDGNCTAGG